MRSRLLSMAVLVTAGLASAAPAAAADPTADKAAGGDVGRREDHERWRRQIFDQLRAMRSWKLTEELKLDEATAAKLFPLLSRYDELERDVGRERGRTYRELRQLSEAATPDQARLDAAIEKMARLRDRKHQLEQEKLAAVRRVLTPQQMAKLLLIIPRLEEQFHRKIRDAIEAARAGGDPNAPRFDRRRFRDGRGDEPGRPQP